MIGNKKAEPASHRSGNYWFRLKPHGLNSDYLSAEPFGDDNVEHASNMIVWVLFSTLMLCQTVRQSSRSLSLSEVISLATSAMIGWTSRCRICSTNSPSPHCTKKCSKGVKHPAIVISTRFPICTTRTVSGPFPMFRRRTEATTTANLDLAVVETFNGSDSPE